MMASRVIKGVTALISPAKIEVTLVSASANKKPGTTFKRSATIQRWNQIIGDLGREIPFNRAQKNQERDRT
jgi:hypothetical protein